MFSYLGNKLHGTHSLCVWVVLTETVQLFIEGKDALTGGGHGDVESKPKLGMCEGELCNTDVLFCIVFHELTRRMIEALTYAVQYLRALMCSYCHLRRSFMPASHVRYDPPDSRVNCLTPRESCLLHTLD